MIRSKEKPFLYQYQEHINLLFQQQGGVTSIQRCTGKEMSLCIYGRIYDNIRLKTQSLGRRSGDVEDVLLGSR